MMGRAAYDGGDVPDKPKSYGVVDRQLIMILARPLEPKDENEGLLAPESCLHQVVPLEIWDHVPVGVACARSRIRINSHREVS